MEITLATLTGDLRSVSVEPSDTIASVKNLASGHFGIPTDHQQLMLGSRRLNDDDALLMDYNVRKDDTITVSFVDGTVPYAATSITPNTTAGSNVALLNNGGILTQIVTGLDAGPYAYSIDFNGGISLTFTSLDAADAVLATYTTTGGGYGSGMGGSTSGFTAPAGTVAIEIQIEATSERAFIDEVTLSKV